MRPPTYDRTVGIVALVGVVTGVVAIGYTSTHPEPILAWTMEFGLAVVPTVLVLYGAWWLTNHRPLADDRRRLQRSALLGTIGIGALAAVYAGQVLLFDGFDGDLVLLVASSAAGGCAIGLAAALLQSSPQHVTFDTPVREVGANAGDSSDPPRLVVAPEELQTIGTVLADPLLVILLEALDGDRSSLPVADAVREITRKTDLDSSTARLRLHHVTLPKAENVGLATLESGTERIVRGPQFDVVAGTIDVER